MATHTSNGIVIQRTQTILKRLYTGQVLDLEAMSVELGISASAISQNLRKIRIGGDPVVKLEPQKALYALAGTGPAIAAARKYHGREIGRRMRDRLVIPLAWDPAVDHATHPSQYAPAVPGGDPAAAELAAPLPTLPYPPSMEETRPPKVTKPKPIPAAVAKAKTRPVKVIVICPDGCRPPQILKEAGSGLVIIDADGRPVDVQIAQKV